MKLKLFILIFAALMINLVSSEVYWGEEISVPFYISSGTPVCKDGTHWQTQFGSNIVEQSSLKDCYKDDGYLSTTCCPYPTHTCNLDTNICEAKPIFLCGQYTDADSCNNANSGVANNTVAEIAGKNICGTSKKYNSTCVEYIGDCKCVWNGGKCESFYDSSLRCENGGKINIGNCTYNFIGTPQDDCKNSGYLFYTSKATWLGESILENGEEVEGKSKCIDKESKIPCDKFLIKLPGFSFFSFIISFIIIIFVSIFRKKFQ